jgi:hypothetical protein
MALKVYVAAGSVPGCSIRTCQATQWGYHPALDVGGQTLTLRRASTCLILS